MTHHTESPPVCLASAAQGESLGWLATVTLLLLMAYVLATLAAFLDGAEQYERAKDFPELRKAAARRLIFTPFWGLWFMWLGVSLAARACWRVLKEAH